jgi:hypothetical protein
MSVRWTATLVVVVFLSSVALILLAQWGRRAPIGASDAARVEAGRSEKQRDDLERQKEGASRRDEKSEYARTHEEASRLQKERDQARAELDQLARQLKESGRNNHTTEARKDLEKNLARLEARIEALTAQLAKANAQLAQLKTSGDKPVNKDDPPVTPTPPPVGPPRVPLDKPVKKDDLYGRWEFEVFRINGVDQPGGLYLELTRDRYNYLFVENDEVCSTWAMTVRPDLSPPGIQFVDLNDSSIYWTGSYRIEGAS